MFSQPSTSPLESAYGFSFLRPKQIAVQHYCNEILKAEKLACLDSYVAIWCNQVGTVLLALNDTDWISNGDNPISNDLYLPDSNILSFSKDSMFAYLGYMKLNKDMDYRLSLVIGNGECNLVNW